MSAPQFIYYADNNKSRLMHKFSPEEKNAWEKVKQQDLNQPEKTLRLKINDMVGKMKQRQTELRDKDQKTWSKELNIDETKSPVQDIDTKNKTMTLLNRAGITVSFKMPSFYRHPHLGQGSLDPVVIIDIDALAGLLKRE